jgi:hypothetical protein
LVLQGTAAMNCEWWQGWRAGENIAIEYRGAEDQTERLAAFAAEFFRRELRSSLLWFAHGIAALGGNHDDPHRVQYWRRAGQAWSCSPPSPPGGNLTADLTASDSNGCVRWCLQPRASSCLARGGKARTSAQRKFLGFRGALLGRIRALLLSHDLLVIRTGVARRFWT